MLNEKLEKAFSEQINKELYSEYFYLAMQAYLAQLGLKGFVNWMSIQVKEERAHAMGLFNYVYERGSKVYLETIEKPKTQWNSVVEVFKDVLEHEKYVTSLINKLYDVAQEAKDRAAMLYLDWYIKEQVEEENSAQDILTQLEMIGEDSCALLALDEKLMARVFTEPQIG